MFQERKTTKPTPTNKRIKLKTTRILIAVVKNAINPIICLSNVITKARMANTLPHFPAAFNQIDITFKTSLKLIYLIIAVFKNPLKLIPFPSYRICYLFFHALTAVCVSKSFGESKLSLLEFGLPVAPTNVGTSDAAE